MVRGARRVQEEVSAQPLGLTLVRQLSVGRRVGCGERCGRLAGDLFRRASADQAEMPRMQNAYS